MANENEVRVEVDGRTLTLSNLEQGALPRTGTTKGEVLNYYAQIAPVLLPHLAGPRRDADPLAARHRRHVVLREERPGRHTVLGAHRRGADHGIADRVQQDGDQLTFPIVDGLADLTYLANLAALELHVHQWTVGGDGRPRNADRMVIDLDPGEPAGLHECCQVALLVRDGWPTGPRRHAGDQREQGPAPVRRPAGARCTPDESTALAKEIAEELQKEHPRMVTATMTKAQRPGKVFLDWSQNSGSKTTISPYSLRGKGAPVRRGPGHLGRGRGGAEDAERSPAPVRRGAGPYE